MHKFYKPNEDVTGIILIKHFLQQGQDKKKKWMLGHVLEKVKEAGGYISWTGCHLEPHTRILCLKEE